IAGSDYTQTSGTLSIPDGRASGTISVPISGDLLNELNETFFVNLFNPQNALLENGQATGLIRNDDALSDISISDTTILEGNSGTSTATFTVSLSAASGQVITVDFNVANGSATAPDDFASSSGTLSFSIGTTSRTVSVTVATDAITESDETFFINLSNAANAAIADNQGVGTITDDDPASLSLTLAPSIFSEGAGSGAATGTVSRSGPTTTALKVLLSSADSSEAIVAAEVTIPAGSSSATFDIAAVDDNDVDSAQIVAISAAAPLFTSALANLTVLDDDGPTLRLTPTQSTVSENGGTTTITVTRNTPTTAALTIPLGSSDASAATVPTSVTIAAGESQSTFVVTGINDNVADGAQIATITASATGFNSGAATVNVTDDENVLLTLSIAPGQISEAGGVATGTLRRNTTTTAPLTIQLRAADPNLVTVPSLVVIPAGASAASFTINAVNDTLLNGARRIAIAASAPDFSSPSATIIVTDDDVLPLPLRISFASPLEGAIAINWPLVYGPIAGGGDGRAVRLYIQRQSDSKYFNGRNWGLSAFAFPSSIVDNRWLPLGGVVPGMHNLRDDRYSLIAVATDTAGRKARTSITLWIDQTAPQLTIQAPADKSTLVTLPAITGRAADALGGTGTARVVLFLRRARDGKFWSGRNWGLTAVALQTQLNGNSWKREAALPRGANLQPGAYFLSAVAYDRVGNRSSSTSAFTIASNGATVAMLGQSAHLAQR
ncbi:MAG: hypothetical protein JWN98_465, partial [Abditibacteriota bacterium]|nr:hypothetical protein [Abditibacteriota bacterium]